MFNWQSNPHLDFPCAVTISCYHSSKVLKWFISFSFLLPRTLIRNDSFQLLASILFKSFIASVFHLNFALVLIGLYLYIFFVISLLDFLLLSESWKLLLLVKFDLLCTVHFSVYCKWRLEKRIGQTTEWRYCNRI